MDSVNTRSRTSARPALAPHHHQSEGGIFHKIVIKQIYHPDRSIHPALGLPGFPAIRHATHCLKPMQLSTHPRTTREANYPMMKLPLSLLAVACAAVLAGCDAASSVTLTQENLDKIHDGMSATQVKTILGAPTASKEEPIPVVAGPRPLTLTQTPTEPTSSSS